MVDAAIGYGAKFHRSADGTSGGAFSTIGEVVSISPPELTREAVETTHLESTNRIREFVAGMRDLGEVSVTLNLDAGDATVSSLLADYADDDPGYYKIIFPDTTEWGFAALLTSFAPGDVSEGKMEVVVTFKPTGSQSFITFS